MTKREAAIVSAFTGVMLGKFSDMHAYVEELFGTPIFSHMFGFEQFANLIKEKATPDFMAIKITD